MVSSEKWYEESFEGGRRTLGAERWELGAELSAGRWVWRTERWKGNAIMQAQQACWQRGSSGARYRF